MMGEFFSNSWPPKDRIEQAVKDNSHLDPRKAIEVALEYINFKVCQSETVIGNLQTDLDKLSLARVGIYPNREESKIFPHNEQQLSQWIGNNATEADYCRSIVDEFTAGNPLPLELYALIESRRWQSLVTEAMRDNPENTGGSLILGRVKFWETVATFAFTSTSPVFEAPSFGEN